MHFQNFDFGLQIPVWTLTVGLTSQKTIRHEASEISSLRGGPACSQLKVSNGDTRLKGVSTPRKIDGLPVVPKKKHPKKDASRKRHTQMAMAIRFRYPFSLSTCKKPFWCTFRPEVQ